MSTENKAQDRVFVVKAGENVVKSLIGFLKEEVLTACKEGRVHPTCKSDIGYIEAMPYEDSEDGNDYAYEVKLNVWGKYKNVALDVYVKDLGLDETDSSLLYNELEKQHRCVEIAMRKAKIEQLQKEIDEMSGE